MNETLKTILTRRSVRSFQSRKIERPDLELILKAATYAPSGMNRQTWQFTAVTDKDEIRKLANLPTKETADGVLKIMPALLRIFFSPHGLWG